ncbi:hypothetical protein PR202_gb03036 [Eleusine coracana subsp. coracana]|uniref:Leucine-rich repeat-containing N-terminal plant-type domain-containing protein n=1 Tax=Eleusine coracana subsp. coracana TaxID=191504 RepID=A0AAV5E096_ELECO|nr:hypothetical protein PR202_gb03036 [Eleusine coracana subsp. coracana]
MPSIFSLFCCLLLFFSKSIVFAAAPANNSEIDRQTLLCFKSGIYSDPLGILNSWLNTSLNFCHWPGVTCGAGIPIRVVSLDLTGNFISGAIPEELGTLPQLQTLMLASNRLEANCSSLDTLILSRNNLSGEIPAALFSYLPRLGTVDLQINSLSGVVPPFGDSAQGPRQ